MDVKPTKGLKVTVNASKEAIFGEDGVEVKTTSIPAGKNRIGALTGRTLAGFVEIEMESLDGKKHWYPTDELLTDKGEKVAEEEIPMAPVDDDESEGEATSAADDDEESEPD